MPAVNLDDVFADFFATPSGGSLGTVAVNIFSGGLPASPAAALAVKQRKGRSPSSAFGASQHAPLVRYPGLSVIVRDPSPAAAWTKMRTAYSKLCNLTGLEAAPFSILFVRPEGEPEQQGENVLGNTVIECRFSVTMREA